MTYRIRTILFLSLLILFLIIAFLTVFYSMGWRFDWKTRKITQPGIFYFKIWPRSVQVYLDGELKDKTDFFFGSILIENLLSKEYEVEIKKEGFHAWKKTLEIKKGEVTETKNIVLIPENPNFTIITDEVNDFFFSPDGKKIVLKESWPASRISPEASEGWSLKLFEIDKNVKSHLINEDDILEDEVELFDLKFSADSNKVLLELGIEEKINYYLLEIDESPPVLTSLGFLEWPEQAFLDSATELENVITFFISNKDIYYLDTTGFVFKNQERLNLIPFEVKEETEYEITVLNSYVFLQENSILYIFDRDKKSFEKFFEPIKGFKSSPDFQKMVYFNDYEIWVLFLEKKYDQPQKEAGEKLFITRFSEKIDNLFWYTSHYLIFNVGDKIKVVEIDDRDKINIVDLAEFSSVAKSYGGSSEASSEGGKEPKIFWSNKKLYILSEKNLYVSEELTP
ncbi:hypothetical protein KJ841_00260 [Patescibacteria group bacterium]|nr:hypothetical protein [Patescibacteria group bacterium]